MRDIVGIDVGGSGVRAALVDCEPVRAELPDRTVDTVVRTITRLVSALGPFRAAGIGVPGFISPDGVVYASPNFPSWREVPLQAMLTEVLGVPVAVENDANAAALGAWRLHGRPRSLALLTLGTGVGGGFVDSGGRLLRGESGTGGELGHIYAGGNARCGCGGVGCLETWCSTVGLLRASREHGRKPSSGKDVVDAALNGEDWAVEVCEEAGRALGRGLTTIVNVFSPSRIVLTGGLAAARPVLEPVAMRGLHRHGIAPSVAAVEISWRGRAEHFAIVGARSAAHRLLRES